MSCPVGPFPGENVLNPPGRAPPAHTSPSESYATRGGDWAAGRSAPSPRRRLGAFAASGSRAGCSAAVTTPPPQRSRALRRNPVRVAGRGAYCVEPEPLQSTSWQSDSAREPAAEASPAPPGGQQPQHLVPYHRIVRACRLQEARETAAGAPPSRFQPPVRGFDRILRIDLWRGKNVAQADTAGARPQPSGRTPEGAVMIRSRQVFLVSVLPIPLPALTRCPPIDIPVIRLPPVANAGPDGAARLGETAALTGQRLLSRRPAGAPSAAPSAKTLAGRATSCLEEAAVRCA